MTVFYEFCSTEAHDFSNRPWMHPGGGDIDDNGGFMAMTAADVVPADPRSFGFKKKSFRI